MNTRINAILESTRGPRVLDVGCVGGLQSSQPNTTGPLWLHRYLHDRFPDVWGIDLSPERVAAVNSAGFPNISVGNAESFSFDHRFDSIVAGELLEHLPSPGRFLACCLEHLNDGGRVIITTPYVFGYEPIAYSWFKWPRTCSNPEHTMWFCPSTLRRLAIVSGFRIETLKLLKDDRIPRGISPYQWALRAGRALQLLPERASGRTMLAVLTATGPQPASDTPR
jgi:SAM-dependent methyltransferase